MIISCEALLFDNDGVLVDSHAQVVHAWTRLCNEYGLDFVALESQILGARAIDSLSRLLEPAVAAEAVAKLEVYEIDLADQTKPVAGALDLLPTVPSERWTIVTSAPRPLAIARFSGAGIPYPSNIVCGDDVQRGKPDPEPYLAGAAKLGIDPANCVVFEDSPAGGAAAVAAGARVVAVGEVEWHVEPIARVKDLRVVTAAATNAGVELTIAD